MMRLRYLYRNFFKSNLFIKLLLLFSCITILTIVTLSYVLYKNMTNSIIRSELASQRQAMDNVDRYLVGKYENAKAMVSDIYRDAGLAQNIYYLLKHPFHDYIGFRLDRYYADVAAEGAVNGLRYFQDKLERDSDIRNIIVYSAEQQYMYVYDRISAFRLIDTNAAHSYVPDVMAMDGGGVTAPNRWVRNTIKQNEPRLYAIRTPINDQRTLKNIGQMMVFFDSDGIRQALRGYEEELRGYIIVMTADGNVIFDSSDRYYGGKYPFAKQVLSLYDDSADIEEGAYVSAYTQNSTGLTIVSVAPKREVAAAYAGLKQTILLIGAACILIAIIIPALFVVNYAKRTHNIIRFMRKVKSGEMHARIHDERDDELGQISRSFNEMVDEMVRYIDRVYKAEIKQKHTELAALQARVNPHFLYNTLEVIRMRAISQGARDVAEMIYSLSVLFQNLVRVKAVYTLQDELEACRLYLELFRIRYKDKFSYEINCEPQLAARPITRMLLQPLVENYIVHGLDASRYDNEIHISVAHEHETGQIRVVVSDNGRGIPEEKLKQIRQLLQWPDTGGDSFGLHSIRERLKLLYGDARSGIELESVEGQGTTVRLWFPGDAEGVEESDV
ncbi:sensor histidine kinase [Paenibacillus sp. GCM10027626]|uniref:sensor histidine kinase n=1 Tax=Paenibacillus sp. GCM10027626 TaxID=3273411 RepID=UPI00362DA749